jgi:hypothetical protein
LSALGQLPVDREVASAPPAPPAPAGIPLQ